jgi:hypothetical protein
MAWQVPAGLFMNNLIVNPTNQSAMWAHFSVSYRAHDNACIAE